MKPWFFIVSVIGFVTFSFQALPKECVSPGVSVSIISETAVKNYGHKPEIQTLTGNKKLSFVASLFKADEDNAWNFDQTTKDDFILADRLDVLIVPESQFNFAVLSKNGCVIGTLIISTDALVEVLRGADGQPA